LPLALLALLTLGLSACEKSESDVIDTATAIPYQTTASIFPDTVDTDTINVGPQRLPEDILPITISAETHFSSASPYPAEVHLNVLSTSGSSVIASGTMSPTGPLNPVLGQRYNADVSFTIERTLVGNLQVEFLGTGSDGSSSNTIRVPLSIIRLNQPPVLSNLQAPDTVALESIQQFLLLQVDVQDPNGSSDIRSVFFNTTRPNGTPSSGNPFAMYDDGTNGDDIPDDGRYSLTVVLPPTTTLGTYTFVFQAVDRSDSLSASIVHFITVKQ